MKHFIYKLNRKIRIFKAWYYIGTRIGKPIILVDWSKVNKFYSLEYLENAIRIEKTGTFQEGINFLYNTQDVQ